MVSGDKAEYDVDKEEAVIKNVIDVGPSAKVFVVIKRYLHGSDRAGYDQNESDDEIPYVFPLIFRVNYPEFLVSSIPSLLSQGLNKLLVVLAHLSMLVVVIMIASIMTMLTRSLVVL